MPLGGARASHCGDSLRYNRGHVGGMWKVFREGFKEVDLSEVELLEENELSCV
jgi:hypothetical protein